MSEDWSEMTRPANESPRHVANLDRWRAKALAANPTLNDEQADRLAETLRSQHYRDLAARSAEARRAKAQAAPAPADARAA